ncbi:MAG TPA: hypothetical protein VIJ20_08010 [Solirubrobacteraceae bacterium]
MRTEVGVMLAVGLLALAGCGGGSHVVTKTVTLTRPATGAKPATTTATPTTPAAPSAAATAAAGRFAATALAANASLAAAPVGAVIFAPAALAATGTLGTQTRSARTPGAPAAPTTRVVAGHASGEYAVAYTNGTFRHPSQIVLNVAASPPQTGSVDWNVVCFETGGGVGREEGHESLQLPTSKSLALPAPSTSCIGSANVQLSKTGTVTISLTG